MPRVTSVKSCRKTQGRCGNCQKEINVGDPYRWWKFRYGGRRVRCMDPKCSPTKYDLTQSSTLHSVYGIQDEIEDGVGLARDAFEAGDMEGAVGRIREAGESAAGMAEEFASECRDAADAWEHGNAELEERADYAEEWEQEISNAHGEADDADEDDPDSVDAAISALEEAGQAWNG